MWVLQPLLSPWLSAALSALGLEISFQSVLAKSVAWVALHFWAKTNTSNYSFDFSVKAPLLCPKSKGLVCIFPSRWKGGEIVLICAIWGVWEQGSWAPGCPSQQLPGLLSALGSCTRAGPCLHLTPRMNRGDLIHHWLGWGKKRNSGKESEGKTVSKTCFGNLQEFDARVRVFSFCADC